MVSAAEPGQFGVLGVQTGRDWPCLTAEEIRAVLAHYPGVVPGGTCAWHSMRPFSAAALVTGAGEACLIKRHHSSLRNVAALSEEHAFMQHLAREGVPVCLPCVTAEGTTALAHNDWTYEVFPRAPGEDMYRDVMSWQSYLCPEHAYAAGQALARLHHAAASYTAPDRAAGRVLISSMAVIGQADLMAALQAWVPAQPGLAQALRSRSWQEDVQRVLSPWHDRLVSLLPEIVPCGGHGDWHGSNLLWTPQGDIACVLDFGMAGRTCAMFDLATALERSMVDWLAPAQERHVAWQDMAAFLRGYATISPPDDTARALLRAFLPMVHVEFALSEVAYFETLLHDPSSASVAYDDYLLGHAQWFNSAEGQAMLDVCSRRGTGA